jgi:hypothetical protein
MKFPIFGASNDDMGTGETYAYVTNGMAVDWIATFRNRRQIPLSEDVTITGFKVFVDTAPGAGDTRTFTVEKGGVDTAVTVTLSDAETSQTFSGSVAFSAGDKINLKSTSTGTPDAPGNTAWYITMETTGSKWLLLGGNQNVAPNGAINYSNPFFSNSWTTTSTAQDTVVPVGCTLTKLSVASNGSPGSGNSYALSLRVNNTTDILTVTVSDAETADSVTGSEALSAGDDIQIKEEPTSTPTGIAFGWCFTVVPDVDGESFFGYGSGAAVSVTGTNYEQPIGTGAGGWSTVDTARKLILPACTIKNLYARISAAPGLAATRTFTLRDNGADSALTTTISDPNTTGNDTTHSVTHTADNTISITSLVSVLDPAAAHAHVGMVIVTAQPAVAGGGSTLMMMGAGV